MALAVPPVRGCLRNRVSDSREVGRSSNPSSSWPSPKCFLFLGLLRRSHVSAATLYRCGLGDRTPDLEKARETGRRSMALSESWRRNWRKDLEATCCDFRWEAPAGKKGWGFRVNEAGLSARPERWCRSTGVLGRKLDCGRPVVSPLDGGRWDDTGLE